MKEKKYISADAAKKSSRGVSAVFAAIMFTVLTASVCLQVFSEGLTSNWMDYILPGILAVNALVLWAVVFSRKKFGLRSARIVQILELIGALSVTAVAAELLITKLAGVKSFIKTNIGVPAVLYDFNDIGMIALLVIGVIIIVYRCASLGYISAAARAQDEKHAKASGRTFSVLSIIFGAGLLLFIPARIFGGTVADYLGIDGKAFGLSDLSFDFASYTIKDYALLAMLVSAPVFYILLGAVGAKMAKSKVLPEAETETDVPVIVEDSFFDEPSSEGTSSEEPAVEGPVVEESVTETPVAEESAVEESVAEAPVIEEKTVTTAIPAAAVTTAAVTTAPVTTAPSGFIPGTKLIDFGYSENEII